MREEHRKENCFGSDVGFLEKYADALVMKAPDSPAAIVVAPGMQARVMTSTAEGDDGLSFGWINRELIAGGKRQEHINTFGGEDRFWLGPEGGQFSIFFRQGDPFDFEHWQTPEPIDWGPWDIIETGSGRTPSFAEFGRRMSLVNSSGTNFDLLASRSVRVLSRGDMRKLLGAEIPGGVKAVGFATDNRIRNEGAEEWRKSTGLLSLWILGMFKPAPSTTVVIPFRTGPVAELGAIVNDAYFGKVPQDRLAISDGVIFFKADGRHRSKVGVSPRRARDVMGSYDHAGEVLTIVKFDLPGDTLDYVNSMWELQKDPYAGDAANSYNDGPAEPGKAPLGPFYELESSSPAAALGPGEIARHVHRTLHFQGTEEELDGIARSVLGVGLQKIKSAL